jgi:hypothetical protein
LFDKFELRSFGLVFNDLAKIFSIRSGIRGTNSCPAISLFGEIVVLVG